MVDALVSIVVQNLYDMARDEVILVFGLKGKMEDLASDLVTIQAVLHDAEMKQVDKDGAVKIWLQKLKYLAYDIQDLLEMWDIQVRYTSSPFSYLKYPIKQHKFGRKLNAISEKLGKISEEKNRYHFRSEMVVERVGKREERQTSSYVNQSTFLGRDRDKEILIRKLVGEDLTCRNDKDVPVISIVGMGGLGKTTLAQIVFNETKSSFEKDIWLCVSNAFNIKDIMTDIVKSGEGNSNKEDQIDLIEREALKVIGKKRYLLVLDDVWDHNELEWNRILEFLNCGANGSRIIVTTRDRRVANAANSMYIHDLGLLSDDLCWSIFTDIVFGESSDEQRSGDLADVGREIVKRCKGVPLAVKTIACAIRKKGRGRKLVREDLYDVLNNDLWNMTQNSTLAILPALMLSYMQLPPELKNCFCYCALFEQDFIYEKDSLTKMWVAQGYIGVGSQGKRELETEAANYFDELVDRSLFQEPAVNRHGVVISCKMHDLVHDLAQWLSKTEFLTSSMNENSENVLSTLANARHCAHIDFGLFLRERDIASIGIEKWRTFYGDKFYDVLKELNSVRVLGLNEWPEEKRGGGLIRRLVHLRYLELRGAKIEELPTSIGELKQLRYLNLKGSRIKKLPKSITSLPHLQTLNLSGCIFLEELVEGIHKMGSLRHLDVSYCWELQGLPEGIGRLTLLQTLGLFRVTAVKGKSGRSNIEELGGLNRLSGELVISNLEAVVNGDEARSAKLSDKTSIESLTLGWSVRGPLINGECVLEALCPPPQLVRLEISGYPGTAFPNWMGDLKFANLEEVNLYDCLYVRELPPLGGLPALKRLNIRKLRSVRKVGSEFLFGGEGTSNNNNMVAFPQLEELSLDIMKSWEKWEKPMMRNNDGAAASNSPIIMPCLRLLELASCMRLEEVPSIFTTTLQCLRVEGSPALHKIPTSIFQHLKELYIKDCNWELMERCKEGGALWPTISKIPCFQIWGGDGHRIEN